jgi:hypothetical protein
MVLGGARACWSPLSPPLVTWSVWWERNGRVFDNTYKPQKIIDQIMVDAKFWATASRGRFSFPPS